MSTFNTDTVIANVPLFRMAVEFDRNEDGTNDRQVTYTLNRSFVALRIEYDFNSDGIVDCVEKNELNGDNQIMSTHYNYDAAFNDSFERCAHFEYFNGHVCYIRTDGQAVGANERVEHITRLSDGRISYVLIDENPSANDGYETKQFYEYDTDGTHFQTCYDDRPGDGTLDGTVDRIEQFYYDEDGTVIRTEFRERGEHGIFAAVKNEYYEHDGFGRVVKTGFDDNADGTRDKVESYVYDDLDNRIEVSIDSDADGSRDIREQYHFASVYNAMLVRVESFDAVSGDVDSITSLHYNDDGVLVYEAFDIDGDREFDELAFVDGINHRLRIDQDFAAKFFGLGRIVLAGPAEIISETNGGEETDDDEETDDTAGATTIEITSDGIAGLSYNNDSYVLNIAGDALDKIRFFDGIRPVGIGKLVSSSGVVMYTDVIQVEDGRTTLGKLYDDAAENTKDLLASLQSENGASLPSLTDNQTYHLGKLLKVLSGSVGRDEFDLSFVTNVADFIDRALVFHVPRNFDIGYSGPVGDYKTVNFDGNETVVTRIDNDENGTWDESQRFVMNDNREFVRQEFDYSYNGTYAADKIDYLVPGTRTVIYSVVDELEDGQMDFMRIGLGFETNGQDGEDDDSWIRDLSKLRGVDTILLHHASMFQLTDTMLAVLADADGNGTADAGYTLTFKGDSEGLDLGSSFQTTGQTREVDSEDFILYTGANITILVDPDISVST